MEPNQYDESIMHSLRQQVEPAEAWTISQKCIPVEISLTLGELTTQERASGLDYFVERKANAQHVADHLEFGRVSKMPYWRHLRRIRICSPVEAADETTGEFPVRVHHFYYLAANVPDNECCWYCRRKQAMAQILANLRKEIGAKDE